MRTSLIKINVDKFKKFVFVGTINTLFGYALFSFFIYIKFDYKIALFLSYIFGITFNFFSFKSFVFKITFNFYILVKFLLAYIFTYSVNVYLIKLLFSFLSNYYLSQLLVLPLTIMITWVSLNYWAFKK